MNTKIINRNKVKKDDFLSKVIEKIICSVCLGILRDPKQCSVCQNCFCTNCIENWIKKWKSCPYQCSAFEMNNASIEVINMLNKLIFSEETEEEEDGDIEKRNNQNKVYPYGEYYGELVNNIREGYGVFKWNNGDKYAGYWKHNKMNGKGKYTDSKGNIYEGYFVNDLKEGYGICKLIDGDRYEGSWKNDKKCGKGKYTYSNGNIYEGDYVSGMKEGCGIFKWINADIYEGNWKNDKMHGKGKHTCHSGNIYEGDYENSIKVGYGIFKWINGDKYEGNWENNKMHGKGKHTCHSGNIHEGDWVNGERLVQ